jgi:hypothetical protein
MLAEVREAIQDARLVGWDLSDVAAIEGSAIDEIERLAERWGTLVVVVAAQPAVSLELQTRRLSNVVVNYADPVA